MGKTYQWSAEEYDALQVRLAAIESKNTTQDLSLIHI